MKPKVLFIQLSDEYTEDDQLSFEDIFELNAHGLEWRMICLKDSPLHRRVAQFGSSKIITLEQPPRHNLDFNLKKILTDEIMSGISLVHIFNSESLGSVLPWLIRFPHVAVVVSEGPGVKKRWSHWFQAFFYSRIDMFLVPTESLMKSVLAMRPVLEKKMRVVRPGLDLNIFNPEHFDFTLLRKKWGIESDYYLVGMVASQEYTKAQGTFIKAAASFLRNEELAKRTKFVIVGFEQEGNEELIELISQFHLQEQIILAPVEDSIQKVLGTLDVFVIPSSKAIFGLQAIEALAMGTAILCASGPESSEWIGNSQSGFLVRSGDSFDLQRKLRMILEDPKKLKTMGKQALEYVQEHYDRKKRTENLSDVYDRALKVRKAH